MWKDGSQICECVLKQTRERKTERQTQQLHSTVWIKNQVKNSPALINITKNLGVERLSHLSFYVSNHAETLII